MIAMPAEEIRPYLRRLRPYLIASVFLFGAGLIAGTLVVDHFPQMVETFESSLAGLINIFRGLPKFKLAAAIFVNNSVKTLAVIMLGALLGVIPALFLLVNGAALGMAVSLSTQTRGVWISLLSILPHGILELPAVMLGTAIGIMMGASTGRNLFAKSPRKIGAEVAQGLRFFATVIIPLLIVAALVEAYVTSNLVAR